MLIDTINLQGSLFYRYRNILPSLFIIFGMVVWFSQDPFITQYKHPQAEIIYETICLLVSSFGLTIRSLTIGFNQAPFSISGEKWSDIQFYKTGMYSIVRHPLYLGNFFIWLGLALYFQSVKFVVCYFLVFTVIYERVIIARENYLESVFGKTYKDWTKGIPAFFPHVLLYVRPKEKFSFQTIVVHEIPVVFFTYLGFYVLEWMGAFFKGHMVESFWHYLMAVTGLVVFVSMMLKKRSVVQN